MANKIQHATPEGPFRAEQLQSGDPYELSSGHAIECLPTGGRGSRANLIGGQVLGSDPDVKSAGVDAGFSPHSKTLRAPDVAVGNVSNEPGWSKGSPPLALEYADIGQDEAKLQEKISDLLASGTRFIWVVRLDGPYRVEIYRPGQTMQIAYPGDTLLAPGVLRNPIEVESLYDPQAANRATLRNLLQREGYNSLDDVRAESEAKGKMEGEAMGKREGEAMGKREGEAIGIKSGKSIGRMLALKEALYEVITAKGWSVSQKQRRIIDLCSDADQLKSWLSMASTAMSVSVLFSDQNSEAE